jgi:flagellar protein FlgJ
MDISGAALYQVQELPLNAGVAGSSRGAGGGNFAELFEKDLRRLGAETGGSPGKNASGPVIDKESKLYEACLALEGFLVKTLLNSMRNTVQKTSLVDQGFAGKMYEDMLYDEYAKDFTRNAGFGLAAAAYLELTGQRGKILNRTL